MLCHYSFLPHLKVELACRCVKFTVQILFSGMLLGRVSIFKECILQLLGTHTIVFPRLMLLFLT